MNRFSPLLLILSISIHAQSTAYHTPWGVVFVIDNANSVNPIVILVGSVTGNGQLVPEAASGP